MLKMSEAIITTLHFTQRKPPIFMFHSQIYALLAEQYQTPKNVLYAALLSITDGDEFSALPVAKKLAYFE
jgi:hypothetical protein